MAEQEKGSNRLLNLSAQGVRDFSSVATFLVTITTLVYLVFPNMKPVEASSATITKVSVDLSVTDWMFFEQYPQALGRDRQDSNSDESSSWEDTSLGAVVYVQADLKGSRNRHFAIHGVVSHVGDDVPLITESKEYTGTVVTPTVSDQRVTLVTWVPLPPVADGSKLYIRAGLYQLAVAHGQIIYRRDSGTLLDVSDSKTLTYPRG
jgi:hypothetical protein